jgi:hypothetical protein
MRLVGTLTVNGLEAQMEAVAVGTAEKVSRRNIRTALGG